MAQLKGIDISRWQGIINWDAVKGAVDFAIIKSSGGDDGLYQDGQFTRNKSEARRTGILRGYYHFAGGVHSPEEEADHFVNTVGDYQKGEVLALDWEISHADPVNWCLTFLKRVEARTGVKPVIYMSGSRAQAFDWTPVVNNNNGLWLAQWAAQGTMIGKWPFWAFWQNSSSGSVPGISGRVDTDLFSGDAVAFQKYGGSTNAPAPAPAPSPPPPPPAPTPTTGKYTVKSGDSLSSIAAKYGTNWQTIYAMNRDQLSDPNKIYPGQVLNVPGGTPSPAPPTTTTYTVQSGDTLSGIAAKYGTSWQQIYAWNQGTIGPNPNFIKPGQVLRVR